jgi:hypothetical protein
MKPNTRAHYTLGQETHAQLTTVCADKDKLDDVCLTLSPEACRVLIALTGRVPCISANRQEAIAGQIYDALYGGLKHAGFTKDCHPLPLITNSGKLTHLYLPAPAAGL